MGKITKRVGASILSASLLTVGVAAGAMASPSPGPGVGIVDDATDQLQTDVVAALPAIMVVAVVIFGATLLWRLVRRFIR